MLSNVPSLRFLISIRMYPCSPAERNPSLSGSSKVSLAPKSDFAFEVCLELKNGYFQSGFLITLTLNV